jgi:hypothetical protein
VAGLPAEESISLEFGLIEFQGVDILLDSQARDWSHTVDHAFELAQHIFGRANESLEKGLTDLAVSCASYSSSPRPCRRPAMSSPDPAGPVAISAEQ